jgi:2-oxoisovalerate dehydrogenase E1 component
MTIRATEPAEATLLFTEPLDAGRYAAERGLDLVRRFVSDPKNRPEVECALRIRAVETALYELFGKGKLHGTIHTCVGQEFSGAILGKHLRAGDFVTSNHRCHGHFIGATQNWRGLIDEIVGNRDGVCAGIGSSQHLWAPNFISNGQQGGLLPVAAGVALDRKTKGLPEAVVSFLGEGTLGEGVLYETLNLDALWGLPHVVICENNFYSQSTRQTSGVAGVIQDRGAAFSLPVFSADTWDLEGFDRILGQALEQARAKSQACFIVLTTYRLNPHSKGDDSREKAEVEWFRARDPATLAVQQDEDFAATYAEFQKEAADYIELALRKPGLDAQSYFVDQLPRLGVDPLVWTDLEPTPEDRRIAQQLNSFYTRYLEQDGEAMFIGEDIEDPYGGAFKISKGMTTAFPDRVKTTPISEAAITGVGVGLALAGRRSFVEIMFGDFITYAFDQIVNNASKIHHMYNHRLDCPVVVRTPMGGRRGYGPTHSQSLERFLVGIDNCCTLSLNSLARVDVQLAGLASIAAPTILLENKSDYTARLFAPPPGFSVKSDNSLCPTLKVAPVGTRPGVSLFAYGGMARFVADCLMEIFERCDVVPALIVPTSLHPLNLAPVLEQVAQSGRLLVVEEGGRFASVGAELIAQLNEAAVTPFRSARLGGKAAPIPSAPSLEAQALPSVDEICAAVSQLMGRG